MAFANDLDPRKRFLLLQERIAACRLCPRLVKWREQVAREKVRRFQGEDYWGRPIPAFGSPEARLVIVGLAPAAHGGNRTGRMFTGDRSGDWLFEALHRYGFANQAESCNRKDGLELIDCVILAAVRCAPPGNKPSAAEIRRCCDYLREEIELLSRKKVVLALGQIAFRSFLDLAGTGESADADRPLKFKHCGEWRLADGTMLISSYHPSQQNTQTGRLTRAMFHEVFKKARGILNRQEG
jgi:uracil-DNA glycosylase